MKPSDRFARVESLYHAARARTHAERAAFLESACAGDAELRREVESLLAQPETGDGLLHPAATGADGLLANVVTPILTGRRLGPYQVRESIGAGGMGEVYRARDTKLGRDVAIKILPAIFSSDPDRLARFDREARLLAALNHPHIAAIYGIEDSDGIRGLVLELVEGDTLAEQIANGPLPIQDVLRIAQQVADALDAAHEKGIVHRDLKPANIKITPDGVVKVLDFGLAKAATADGAGPDLTQSPTGSMGGTRDGVILGTAAYMSPEQARGKPVDKRTDVWAFGCVVYEMLSGRAAFAGDTLSDTIAAILGREPDWSVLPAATPDGVRWLLRRCLDKDARRRLRDIGDARFLLEESPNEGVAAATRAPRFSHRERLAWLAIAAVAALAAWTTRREAPEDRLEITTPATIQPASLAISPDGRTLAFVASSNGKSFLWLREFGNTTPTILAGTENAKYPFWSPDGRSIGFSVESDLKRIDLDSRAVRLVARDISIFGGAWLEDGTILSTPNQASPLVRVAAGGGQVTEVTQVSTGASFGHRFPHVLPDGRHFLFFAGGTDAGIYVGDIGETTTRKILDASAAVYAPTGHLLFVRQRTLYSQPFDLTRLEVTGTPALIAQDVVLTDVDGGAALSVSAAGPIVYRTGGSGTLRQLVRVDRDGKERETLSDLNQLSGMGVSLSADDAFLAWTKAPGDLWLFDFARRVPTQFTDERSVELHPVWSPDRRRVVYSANSDVDFDLFVKSTTGSGGAELIQRAPLGQWADDWSPDGRFILYTTSTVQDAKLPGAVKVPVWANVQPSEIWALQIDGTRMPFPVVQRKGAAASGQFSPPGPRGTWVAFQSIESDRFQIYAQPFSKGEAVKITTAGGVQPRWRRDGKELYYIDPDNRLMAVPVDFESVTAPFGTPVHLFTPQWSLLPHHPTIRNYSVSRDGRFLIDVFREVVSPVTVIQNWKPDGG